MSNHSFLSWKHEGKLILTNGFDLPISWSPATIDFALALPTLSVVFGSLGGGAGGGCEDFPEKTTADNNTIFISRFDGSTL